jgi:SHS2 domain-containing protein
LYRWVEHTAELELAIEAASEEAMLADALAALRELLAPDDGVTGEEARRTIAVSAPDRPALLACWLEELVYLAESEGFVGSELAECRMEDTRLVTVVRGGFGEPRPIVKAVTYHRLSFEPRDGGYVASVVLDV